MSRIALWVMLAALVLLVQLAYSTGRDEPASVIGRDGNQAESGATCTGTDLHALVQAYAQRARTGDLNNLGVLRNAGKDNADSMLREALPLLRDKDWHVRYVGMEAIRDVKDDGLIPVLAAMLADADSNVSDQAIDTLFEYPTSSLARYKERLPGPLLGYLAKYDDSCHKAALILGDIGAKSSMPKLRSILQLSETILAKGPDDSRYYLAPLVKDACVTALFMLGDRGATKQVQSWLGPKASPKETASGMRVLAYIGTPECLGMLIPLLDDDRDVQPINECSGGIPGPVKVRQMRVKDIAAYALRKPSQAKVKFLTLQYVDRYSDDEIERIRASVTGDH